MPDKAIASQDGSSTKDALINTEKVIRQMSRKQQMKQTKTDSFALGREDLAKVLQKIYGISPQPWHDVRYYDYFLAFRAPQG